MTRRIFELKPEEMKAVIGGAVYYASVNKLPTTAMPIAAPMGTSTPAATLFAR